MDRPYGSNLGKFRIPHRDLVACPDHEVFRLMFARCVVLEAKFNLEKGCHEYLALSPDFAPMAEGGVVPVYVAWLDFDTHSVEFVMQDEYERRMAELRRKLAEVDAELAAEDAA